MKKKKWKTGRLHWPGSRRKHEADTAARLTPLEEMNGFERSPQGDGKRAGVDDTIRVGGGNIHMPEQLIEEDGDASSIFRLEPVAIFILVLMLAFVAFIAWQITLMPPK